MLTSKGFDLWADGYDKSVDLSDESNTYPFSGYKAVLARIYDIIRSNCGKCVLDIGFGTGVLTSRLYNDGYQITGIDFSERMIEIARGKMPNAALIQHDFSLGLPEILSDCKYDAIICTYSMHHLTDERKSKFIAKLIEHLSPNGKLLIGDIAFSTRTELEECRKNCIDDWDDDEFYFVAEEIYEKFPDLKFEKLSFCAGVMIINTYTQM